MGKCVNFNGPDKQRNTIRLIIVVILRVLYVNTWRMLKSSTGCTRSHKDVQCLEEEDGGGKAALEGMNKRGMYGQSIEVGALLIWASPSPTACLHYQTLIYSRRSKLKFASSMLPTALVSFAAKARSPSCWWSQRRCKKRARWYVDKQGGKRPFSNKWRWKKKVTHKTFQESRQPLIKAWISIYIAADCSRW